MTYLHALGPPEDCTAVVPFVRAPIWFRPRETILARMKVTFNKMIGSTHANSCATLQVVLQLRKVSFDRVTGTSPPGLFVRPRETISPMWDTSFRCRAGPNGPHGRGVREKLGSPPNARKKVTFNKGSTLANSCSTLQVVLQLRKVSFGRVTGTSPPELFARQNHRHRATREYCTQAIKFFKNKMKHAKQNEIGML